jgi:hypothetical protein
MVGQDGVDSWLRDWNRGGRHLLLLGPHGHLFSTTRGVGRRRERWRRDLPLHRRLGDLYLNARRTDLDLRGQ